MIYIKELLRLKNIENLRLIAGESGMERSVSSVVLYEYDSSHVLLPDFYEGDLVLTTLAYARGEPGLVSESLLALLNQKVAGILIKTAYFSELPQEVLSLADNFGTPVFLFDRTYIEDVLLQVTDLIRGNSRFRGYEKDIATLMKGELTKTQVRERLKNMNLGSLGSFECFCIHPDGPMSVYEALVLSSIERNHELEKEYLFMEADQTMVILHQIRGNGSLTGKDALNALCGSLKLAEGLRQQCSIGISALKDNQFEIGNALVEAMVASKASGHRENQPVHADELGIDAYLFPLLHNRFVVHRCMEDYARLLSYDRENHASLAETARIFIESDLDVTETAEKLYQHTNTVRYRLRKIRSLINCDSDATFHAMLYLIITLNKWIDLEGV
ncbi:MAG: PucR family transcriptional regulator [Clostridia bacterium]|nr:PucR family transcriptional regulator [Clostridia bacterium]